MGTSSARQNPGGRSWENLNNKIRSGRPVGEVADLAIRAILPALPDGSVKAPIYVAAVEAVKFAYEVRRRGFSAGAKHYAIGAAGSTTGSAIGEAIWNVATRDLPPAARNTMVTRIAGNAFKETMAKIAEEGAKAL